MHPTPHVPAASSDRPEIWLWTELIGFDNEQADYGVARYLEDAGFVPHAVSLLMFTADFVHTHGGLEREQVFPPDFCSYLARPYSDQRARQAWTNFQLRGLVRELQKHGIEVYFSVFNMYTSQYSEWARHHPEILETNRAGTKHGAINVLRRMADGNPYEEFFVSQVGRVLDDYGFDGFHAADGYSSPRSPISEIDYSDDMVLQFAAGTGVDLPSAFAAPCDGDPGLMEQRADWIWRNKRIEWIQYYARLWEQYCRRLVDTVHRRGKKVVLNSVWTRDPFEALYRYGIDYRRMAGTGVDGFVVETVAPSASVYGLDPSTAHYNYAAMLMLIKAHVPGVKLINLNCIKDTLEQWDALRHHPTVLERDTYGLANVFVYHGGRNDLERVVDDAADRDERIMNTHSPSSARRGKLERCTSGLVGCLCDSILPHEWKWLRETWDIAFQPVPERLRGLTLVWSDTAHEAFLCEFVKRRIWSVHRFLRELMLRGAPILAVADPSRLHLVEGPILVIYPELLSEDELRSVESHPGGVMMIGTRIPATGKPEVLIRDGRGEQDVVCAVWSLDAADRGSGPVGSEDGAGFDAKEGAGSDAGRPPQQPLDLSSLKEPQTWLYDLYCRNISEEFLGSCARLAGDLAKGPRIVSGPPAVKVVATESKEGVLRLFISNDATHYNTALIDVGTGIEQVNVVTRYPGTPVSPMGSRLNVRIPAGGMVILDVSLEERTSSPRP